MRPNLESEISVIIGTCDSYSPLWKNFDILFNRYFELKTKNILVSETLTFDNPTYHTITPGQKPWGERILEGLNQIETKYVYFLLDDYYLTEPVSKERISYYLDILEKYNAVKIHFDTDPDKAYRMKSLEDNIVQLTPDSEYLTALQPGIWRVDWLKEILKPEYSPWDMEIIGSKYVSQNYQPILMNFLKERQYFNFVRIGGRISEGWEQLYIKENLK